jgi:sugar O-acyltransferase (sialic acid O-acetyltransferase NeuD family)
VKQIVIIGAGGHGREVAEILRHQSQTDPKLELLGFIDDDLSLKGQVRDGLPILGDWSWFNGIDKDSIAVICAVGMPSTNRRLAQRARAYGLQFTNAISPLSCISDYASIGEGVTLFPYVVVNTGSRIEDHCILNVGVTVSHDTVLGRYSNVNPGAHLAGNVTVGEGCYIGMGTNVIQGRTLGAWTTVGAGAVVTQSLPPNVTAVGIPTRVIKVKEDKWYEQ